MPSASEKPPRCGGRAILESPLRVGVVLIERKPVGNAVPGVPGDRKGRPYGVGVYLCAGSGGIAGWYCGTVITVPYIGSAL